MANPSATLLVATPSVMPSAMPSAILKPNEMAVLFFEVRFAFLSMIVIDSFSCFFDELIYAIASFNQFFQPLNEARRGSAVHDVVIDADRHA